MNHHGNGKGVLLAERLGLRQSVVSWHTDRRRIADVCALVGRLARCMAKIATDVAILSSTEIGVGSALETGLVRIERALAKLEEGSYGVCDACGGPIAPARLQAMPDGVLCLACAQSQGRARPARRR